MNNISSLRQNAVPVVPDRLDFRDRLYQPPITRSPRVQVHTIHELEEALNTRQPATVTWKWPVLNQGATASCTGCALAAVVNYLLIKNGRAEDQPVSPQMLYSMARRYDEFPGGDEPTNPRDTGSSLRGALRGWYQHGVCALANWGESAGLATPPPSAWWHDAARRPLGAYYRIDRRNIEDIHAALNDVGIVYASARLHEGWEAGAGGAPFVIARPEKPAALGGHAFAIVGYNQHGFLILNSWGEAWGGGYGLLTYDDWDENGMDAWVVQLGVVTERHGEVAEATTLRSTPITTTAGPSLRVDLATERQLRNHELMPFIVNVEKDGLLSATGEFRTRPADLQALLDHHLPAFRAAWGKSASDPLDVAIFAHGGLTGEEGGADVAARWIPALYEAGLFPIFLMWETDLLSTLRHMVEDLFATQPAPAGGLINYLSRQWDGVLENTLAPAGTAIWREMKDNARALTANPLSGLRRLTHAFADRCADGRIDAAPLRLHLIGHSAGAIVHTHLARYAIDAGFTIDSLNFLAPAVRVDTFQETLGGPLAAGKIGALNEYHLAAALESADATCRPIVGYGRSLLWLVAQSFEGGKPTPILGIKEHFDLWRAACGDASRVHEFIAVSTDSTSTTHGDFARDDATRSSVIARIKEMIQARDTKPTTLRLMPPAEKPAPDDTPETNEKLVTEFKVTDHNLAALADRSAPNKTPITNEKLVTELKVTDHDLAALADKSAPNKTPGTNEKLVTEAKVTDHDLSLPAKKPTSSGAPVTSEKPPPLLPPKAIQLILESEGLDQPSRWPGEDSGITLGRGYDLGAVSRAEFQRDWSPYLKPEEITALSAVIGLSGERARVKAPSFRGIKITTAAADAVFANATLPKYFELTRRALPGFDGLPPLVKGALVSLVFNRGASMGVHGQPSWARRCEMREIRDAVARGGAALHGIPTSLRKMKRLWVGRGVDGLLTRRENEAKLVEEGLAQAGDAALFTVA